MIDCFETMGLLGSLNNFGCRFFLDQLILGELGMGVLLRFGNSLSKRGGHVEGVQGRAEWTIKKIIKSKSKAKLI